MGQAFNRTTISVWFALAFIAFGYASASLAVEKESGVISHKPVFSTQQQPITGSVIAQSTTDLCLVAGGTLDYLNKGQDYDPMAIRPGIVKQFSADLDRVKRTLAFICQVSKEDNAVGRKSRLQDLNFINQHFDMIRWRPNKQQSRQFEQQKTLLKRMPDEQILLTKYYIKKAKGSPIKTAETPHALYQLPFDEQELTLEQAQTQREKLTRFQLTKQQVLTGVLDHNQWAKPLVWFSRADLEDTLMQGTVKIDGSDTFYNVHRNNGIGYQRNVPKEQQERYWYFKQTDSVLGYGKDANYKIPIKPLVTVAGDLEHLGLGKLIMLTMNNEHRLTILADTGGAFENNQYQLDYLGGYFYNWRDYHQHYKNFPDYAEARILLLKD
ncbi:hypothetical protein [Psychrobium sp. 1_MG-2023]|uniref:hypothetical protein n=1 Tax=Psychrobium sp. 1_MG-2023 TaxID=3062624 RepID=UPI000C33940E|nr:hypothetical protein [Psychrobium sp. 1_MG-2023]MDP2561087.1 hypothetical protein [Psychrobium sp. 1_MG-2023]PKF58376.1 hypothetical protein CW748_04235 [Alteromonadales bacterium alter-6D02]